MLKRVSIQNFKSLKDVTLDLQKVNLLIGPNNSGKTNFLKALEYVGKEVLPHAEEPNRNSYAFNHNEKINIEIRLKFDANQNEVVSLHNSIIDDTEYIVLGCTINSLYHVTRSIWEQQHRKPSIITNAIHDKDFLSKFFKRNISYITLYKPDPNKLDKPGPVGRGDDSVAADASNLIAFFDRIRDEYPASFAQIKADLAKCVPEFTEINFQNVESTKELVKEFGDKTFKRIGLTNGRQKTIYWADELSEGTLYFIALLCIINQPNPPKLLLLEEPEKGIHPRRIREVMDFIFRLAEEKDIQIILTSHNEHVLDDFATRPEAVFVFDKDDEGATYVRNLQKDIIEPTNQRNRELGLDEVDLTTNLSENWLYGLLGGVPSIP